MQNSIVIATNKDEYRQLWHQNSFHLLQSWEWADVKAQSGQVIRVIFTIEGKRLPLLVQVKSVPVVGKIAYIAKFYSVSTFNTIKNELQRLLKTFGINIIHVEFAELDEVVNRQNKSIFAESIQPHHTNIVDLAFTEEELRSRLKPKYRNNINKAVRSGMTVEAVSSGDEAINDFLKIMDYLNQTTKYIAHSDEYFNQVWKILCAAGMARIYLAKFDSQIVGAYLVAFDNTTAYELYGGVNQMGRNNEAGYLLKWAAILDAKKSGKSFYDHWGVAPFDAEGNYQKDHELYNISLFKLGFGGKNIKFMDPQILYSSSSSRYLYKALSLGKSMLLKLKKASR